MRTHLKWTINSLCLYNSRMSISPSFLESLHHVPGRDWTRTTLGIVRAGKVLAGPEYRIVRDAHIGQDILYCLSGAGTVETLDQQIDISAGQLAWIANERPHAHFANPDDPWTLLWFRMDGPDPIVLRNKLFGESAPVAFIPEPRALQAWFDRLFLTMRGSGSGIELRLNLLASEFMSLLDVAIRGDGQSDIPASLNTALLAMRGDLRKTWKSDDLSALTKLSASQARRLFRKHLRTSPHQWLLRERLMRAQALITDSSMALAEVAEVCGFCDVYHFSREFKRSIGTPPAAWRRRELGRGL